MSQANWDRSTIGGAGADASRRRMLAAAAAGLGAGLAAGFLAGLASGVAPGRAQLSPGTAHAGAGREQIEARPVPEVRGQAGLSAAA